MTENSQDSEVGRFLTAHEKHYRSLRAEKLSELDPLLIADNPFLFAKQKTINEAIARYELFKQIINVSGAIIECGVYNGNNLLLFSHFSSIFEPNAINRKIIGFDTFAGFRSLQDEDPKDISEETLSDANLEALKNAVDLYDMNRSIGHMKKIEIIEGDAVETIPEYVLNAPSLTVALLYLDFDIYKPTKIALEYLAPLVCKGGIIVFDECNYDKFPGETQALKKYFKLNETEIKRFYFNGLIGYIKI